MPTGSLTHRITHTALYCCMPCRTFAPVVILCVRLPVGIACVHGCLFSLKFWGAVTQNWCISGPIFNERSYLTFAHRSHPHSLARPFRYTLYVCMHVLYMHVYVFIYVCMYVCIYLFIYLFIY